MIATIATARRRGPAEPLDGARGATLLPRAAAAPTAPAAARVLFRDGAVVEVDVLEEGQRHTTGRTFRCPPVTRAHASGRSLGTAR